MEIRFQADADLNHAIVLGVVRREPSIDFRSAVAAELAGVADPDVLRSAAEETRILVTHDRRTMPFHFADFIEREMSPGLIVVPQHMPIGTAVAELVLLWTASEAADWANRIVWLPV